MGVVILNNCEQFSLTSGREHIDDKWRSGGFDV